jgi:L-ribulose-5-phosphate 3-epimerase
VQRVAIMQGRLLPPIEGRFQCFPRGQWAKEFALASEAGLQAIEWIYDVFGEDVNPISADDGIADIQRFSQEHGVAVVSLCADYFMDQPLVRVPLTEREERLSRLLWLFGRCSRLGICRLVLPFVDNSRVETKGEEDEVVGILERALPVAGDKGLEIHLETSLGPARLAALLARLPQENLKVNYDSGNSASLGYLPCEELAAYGPRIGSVHIKDRTRGGGTVPLGRGDANFLALFRGFCRLGYTGDFVLQAARGEPGAEVEWARRNRSFLIEQMQGARAACRQ